MQLIFYLNTLADSTALARVYQNGLVNLLNKKYGQNRKWAEAYQKILADWDAYHADLNFAGEDGMAMMRESRFRVMRALFRIVGESEPSQDELHALADEALATAPVVGSAFYPETTLILEALAAEQSICLTSYFPQAQLEAIVRGGKFEDDVRHYIGADTFERYPMDETFFQMLLHRLDAKPEDCLLIDKQKSVLDAAQNLGIHTLAVAKHQQPASWWHNLHNYLKQP